MRFPCHHSHPSRHSLPVFPWSLTAAVAKARVCVIVRSGVPKDAGRRCFQESDSICLSSVYRVDLLSPSACQQASLETFAQRLFTPEESVKTDGVWARLEQIPLCCGS